ncbi:hypothetical protein Q8A67_020724 [Cirrhinus molitorella]|uniref:Uncharacterized protein n=1 Tax=Cirrhinus molitorella TaxID=172907 RepID=A0AA88PCE7_9TELE|nr:hypothetical protein Q8A67_020724 [Cirrhinus molitorella]
MLADPELIAAAILVPKFKTCWTSDENILKLGLDYIRSHLDCQAESHISEGSQSSEEEDFFSSLKKTSPLETTQQLDAYLGCPGDTVEFIDGGNRGASAQNKQTKSKMGSAGRQWAADEGSAQEKQQRRENRNPEIRSRNLEQPSRRSKHRRTDKDKTD